MKEHPTEGGGLSGSSQNSWAGQWGPEGPGTERLDVEKDAAPEC